MTRKNTGILRTPKADLHKRPSKRLCDALSAKRCLAISRRALDTKDQRHRVRVRHPLAKKLQDPLLRLVMPEHGVVEPVDGSRKILPRCVLVLIERENRAFQLSERKIEEPVDPALQLRSFRTFGFFGPSF